MTAPLTSPRPQARPDDLDTSGGRDNDNDNDNDEQLTPPDPLFSFIADGVTDGSTITFGALADHLGLDEDSLPVVATNMQFTLAAEALKALEDGRVTQDELILGLTAAGSEAPGAVGIFVDAAGNLAISAMDEDGLSATEAFETVAPIVTIGLFPTIGAVTTGADLAMSGFEILSEAGQPSFPNFVNIQTLSVNGINTSFGQGGRIIGPQVSVTMDTFSGGGGSLMEFNLDPGDLLRPVVIDLAGDGIDLSLLGTASFDIDQDGYREQMGWVGPSDGLLVIDLSSNGELNSGDGVIDQVEEFAFALWVDGDATDLQALAQAVDDDGNLLFDSNGDGILSSDDTQWNSFKIWQDLDQDGATDPGELRTLSEWGISDINLSYDNGNSYASTDDDIFIGQSTVNGQSSYTRNGHVISGGVADVSFIYDDDGWKREDTDIGFDIVWQDGERDRYLSISEWGSSANYSGSSYNGVYGDSRDNSINARFADHDVILDGADGNDYLSGGHGNDQLIGGEGSDLIYGGNGNDTIVADFLDLLSNEQTESHGLSDNGIVRGGSGRDTLIITGNQGVHMNLGTKEVEIVYGSEGNDRLHARDLTVSVLIDGRGGNDFIEAGKSNDIISGGEGNDSLFGGAGNDSLYAGNGTDRLYGGGGNDVLDAGTNTSTTTAQLLYGGDDDDVYAIGSDSGFTGVWGETVGGGNDRVLFTDTNVTDLTTIKEQASNPDRLELRTAGDGVNLRVNASSNIESFEFADGTVINSFHFGDDGSGNLTGDTGADYFDAGRNTTSSGVQFLRGRDGDDVYAVSSDSGYTAIWDETATGGTDRVIFEDLNLDDFTSIRQHPSIVDGMILNATGLNLHFNTRSNIESFEFADGTVINSFHFGGDGSDRIYGGVGNDQLHGQNGTDSLYGGAGNDSLYGGNGDDYLRDEAGLDLFNGGTGSDTVSYWGHTGGMTVNLDTGYNSGGDTYISIENVTGSDIANDNITGSNAANALSGAGGNDVLKGLDGSDHIYGGVGNDQLHGQNGTDSLYGGTGNDSLYGGNGDDYLRDEDGIDIFHGGAGSDTVSYWGHTGGMTVNLDTGANSGGDTYIGIENVTGSDIANDSLTGSNAANVLSGAGGDDVLKGGGGNDRLYGGAENDHLTGQFGNDALYGGLGSDYLNGQHGDDILSGGSGADHFRFFQSNGNDRITDFEDDIDTISFGNTNFSNLSDAFSIATQDGSDVVFDFGDGSSLTVENTTINNLSDDLILV